MLKHVFGAALAVCVTGAADLPFKRIDEIIGLAGKWNQDEAVYKVTSPRNDVKVRVDAWEMPPFMGLTSWAAFTPGEKDEAMVMGDLVLLQDEVNPVMSAAFENGLDVTALHNHFFFDEPKVYFMHIAGEGSAEKLATGVKAALDKVKQIRSEKPEPSRSFGGNPMPSKNTVSPQPIASVLGKNGEAKDGMFKVVIGRTATMNCGCKVGKEMGVNTWAAFAGTDDNAIVDGDFAVLETELQPVLRSLRKDGINIVAIHHHMSKEQPRILFLHYWGRGTAQQLATSVKNALKHTDTGGTAK